MRHSFFLHLALGLLSWSSQLVGASTEVHTVPAQRSNHLSRPEMRPLPLALTSTHKAAKAADVDR
jgi:hypothetical protein